MSFTGTSVLTRGAFAEGDLDVLVDLAESGDEAIVRSHEETGLQGGGSTTAEHERLRVAANDCDLLDALLLFQAVGSLNG